MACNIEDAGFEIRDMIAWVYGSGFPKSLDVSKAIDKAAGAEREVIGQQVRKNDRDANSLKMGRVSDVFDITARQWQGWGTALKPALEPITVARKPLIGTVAENVLTHGTGAINVDGCRVGETVETWPASRSYAPGQMQPGHRGQTQTTGAPGRWPANLIHDGSDDVTELFPESKGQIARVGPEHGDKSSVNAYGDYGPRKPTPPRGDSGSAARFFYCAKASPSERGLANKHPTVKPLALMKYLLTLVTPPGGVILDPFCGSGTTLLAAKHLGITSIGIELEEANCATISTRLNT